MNRVTHTFGSDITIRTQRPLTALEMHQINRFGCVVETSPKPQTLSRDLRAACGEAKAEIQRNDSANRKATPICTGVLDYFPDALADVARLSKIGNDKHNPGEMLHWSRDKSTDHADCLLRHQAERNDIDPEDGILHATKVAWRALAQLQVLIETRRKMGLQ